MSATALRIVEGSSMDKTKALSAALSQIERQFGKGSVMRLGDEARAALEVIPTGAIALDVALGIGGLPRGRVVEIYGPESSGKTTVALHAVANAQRGGGIVAFIDAEHALDPDYAKALGVDTDALQPAAVAVGRVERAARCGADSGGAATTAGTSLGFGAYIRCCFCVGWSEDRA